MRFCSLCAAAVFELRMSQPHAHNKAVMFNHSYIRVSSFLSVIVSPYLAH